MTRLIREKQIPQDNHLREMFEKKLVSVLASAVFEDVSDHSDDC